MTSKPLGRRHLVAQRWLIAILSAVLCLGPSSASADAISTAVAVKAAFLFNFAKFAEWPADALAPGQRLSMCVVGDTAVADALEQTIDGRAVEGHQLTVQVLGADGPVRGCHLLYVSGLNAKGTLQMIATLKGAAVLAVSDSDGFAEAGGVAQLIQEHDRMRFAINVRAAKQARLTLSAKLLGLAQIVKDDQDVPR